MALERHICFYHGTSEHQTKSILANGFNSGYLTQCSDQADYYAQEAVEADQEKGIDTKPSVLVIKVPVSGLRPDFPSIENPLTVILEKHDIASEDAFFVALDQDKFGWPDGIGDWQRGLFLTDSVFFEGDGSLIGLIVSNDEIIGFSDFDKTYPQLESIDI